MGGRLVVLRRRHLGWGLAAALLLLPGLASRGPLAPAPAPPLRPVVIDPGHGGIDGGASGGGVLEKEITLAVALRLAEHLQAAGVPVALTREADQDLGGPAVPGRHRRDLAARLDLCRRLNAALLVSLHANTTRNRERRGALVFFDRRSPASGELAAELQRHLAQAGPVVGPGPEAGDFYILRLSPLPAALVELGFLSNHQDLQTLRAPAGQEALARALAAAVAAYYRKWQVGVSGG